MKILVAVKRVIDYNVQIRVKEDGSGVHTDNVKMSTNPPDDNAVEESVKLKESGKVKEVIAISIGEDKAQETIRKALAIGADNAVRIDAEPTEAYFTATQISAYAKDQSFDLVPELRGDFLAYPFSEYHFL